MLEIPKSCIVVQSGDPIKTALDIKKSCPNGPNAPALSEGLEVSHPIPGLEGPGKKEVNGADPTQLRALRCVAESGPRPESQWARTIKPF